MAGIGDTGGVGKTTTTPLGGTTTADATGPIAGAKAADPSAIGSRADPPRTDPTAPPKGTPALQAARPAEAATSTLAAKQAKLSGLEGVAKMFGESLDEVSETAIETMLLSQTMKTELVALAKEDWEVIVSTDDEDMGQGWCGDKMILMGADLARDDREFLQTIAHEGGHAFNAMRPDLPSRDLVRSSPEAYAAAKEAYIAENLKDEGAATYNNIVVQREIRAAGGMDIGILGANAEEYDKTFDKAKAEDWSLDKTYVELGSFYGTGEVASVPITESSGQAKEVDYETYYGWEFEQEYGGPPASGSQSGTVAGATATTPESGASGTTGA